MYYVQNKCIFLKTVRIQISKGLKKCKILNYLQSCYTETNQILAHIHTLKNFQTQCNKTKHTSYIFNFKKMRKERMYCTKLTVTSL